MTELLYKELSCQIRGMLYEAHPALGPGVREETCKIAVLAEMRRRGRRAKRAVGTAIRFKGEIIDRYRLDIVADDKVTLELKTVDEFHPRHRAPLLSYLKASGLARGPARQFRLGQAPHRSSR